MTRDLKALLASSETVLGTWTQIAAAEVMDLVGLNGFEFSIIDCQHAPFGIETADNLIRAADANNIAAVVRVSRNDPVEVMKALDAGARHVVIPNIETADEASHAVAATKFGPDGLRGACPCCRSGGHYIRNWADYVRDEEAQTGAIALVETVEGHRNIAEICAVPGLSAIIPGPFDLSVSMGLNGDWRHRHVSDAVEDIVDAAQTSGIPVMMPVFSPDPSECREMIDKWSGQGVTNFVIGSDKIIVAEAFSSWSRALRQ